MLHLAELRGHIVYPAPKTLGLSIDLDVNVSLCVTDFNHTNCHPRIPVVYKEIMCEVTRLYGHYEVVTIGTFNRSMPLCGLQPGVYDFFCRLDYSSNYVRSTRVITKGRTDLLDCASRNAVIDMASTRFIYGMCCKRPAMPANWARMLGRDSLCAPMQCTLTSKILYFLRDKLVRRDSRKMQTAVVWVICDEGRFWDVIFVISEFYFVTHMRFYMSRISYS